MRGNEKLVKKRLPVSLLDLPGVEGWLNGLAAQGLILAKCGPRRFRFRREAPRPGRRYHLCPTKDTGGEAPQELVELYQQSGWQYAATAERSYVCIRIFYTDDPAAPEPFNDADSLLQALRYPVRECVGSLVFALVVPVLYVLLGTLVSDDDSFLYFLIALVFLSSVVSSFTDLATVLLFRRSLRRGKTLRPGVPRLLNRLDRGFTAVMRIVWVLTLLLVLPPAILTKLHSDTPLEEFQPDFDLLTLEEMEGNGSWTPRPDQVLNDVPGMSSSMPRYVFRYNDVDVRYYPLYSHLRTQYWVDQTGTGDSGGSSMNLHYYVARSPRWAQERLDDLAADQAEDFYTKLTAPYHMELVPGAEKFLVRREGLDWEVLAQSEDRVLALQYSGSLDLTEWYDEIAAMLAPLE